MDIYSLDLGRSYVECQIDFGDRIDTSKWNGIGPSPWSGSRRLIFTVRDEGKRAEYVIEDENQR